MEAANIITLSVIVDDGTEKDKEKREKRKADGRTEIERKGEKVGQGDAEEVEEGGG